MIGRDTKISRVSMYPTGSDTCNVWFPGATLVNTCTRIGGGPDTLSGEAPSRVTCTSTPTKTRTSTLTVEPSILMSSSSHSFDGEGVGVMVSRSGVADVGAGVWIGVGSCSVAPGTVGTGAGAALDPQARPIKAKTESINIRMNGFIISFSIGRDLNAGSNGN